MATLLALTGSRWLSSAKTAKGILSLVSKLFSLQSQKEVVRTGQKAQTAGIVVSDSKKSVSATVASIITSIGLITASANERKRKSGDPEVTEFYFVTGEASDCDLNHGWQYWVVLDPSSAGPEWDNRANDQPL